MECPRRQASLFIVTRYRERFALEWLVAALVLVTAQPTYPPSSLLSPPSHNLLFVAARPDQKWLTHDLSVCGSGPAWAKLREMPAAGE